MTYQRISVDTAREILASQSPLLLDIRDPAAYGRGHVAGAINLSSGDTRSLLNATPKAKPILVYCYHGNASQDIARMFADFGFSFVYSVDGGYAAWAGERPQLAAPASAPALRGEAALRDWLIAEGYGEIGLHGAAPDGATPLIRACRQGRSELAEQLLAAGAALDAVDGYGNDALWAACYSGDLATIGALLDAGVDLDRRNPAGSTALMYAASAGKSEVASFLLECGANPSLRNQDDYSALDLAADAASLKVLKQWTRRQQEFTTDPKGAKP